MTTSPDTTKQRVRFVYTHNSARSQMAEGLLRARHGNRYEVASAGTNPSRVHPEAVRVMAEVGIDITGHDSQHVNAFLGRAFDRVITVCDHAHEVCPFSPGAREYVHVSFPDPSAAPPGSQQTEAFRRVRDRIAAWIDEQFAPFSNDDRGAPAGDADASPLS